MARIATAGNGHMASDNPGEFVVEAPWKIAPLSSYPQVVIFGRIASPGSLRGRRCSQAYARGVYLYD